MRHIRSHLTYANVMATIAVFLVLGGGTAAALSGSNTVFSDDIVNNQVQSPDVRDDTLSQGGLGAPDLAPNSVGGSEVINGSLPPADSKNVVARARGNSSVSGRNQAIPYPLSGNIWTQAANETDVFLGEITANASSACASDGGGAVQVRLFVDGNFAGNAGIGLGTMTGVQTRDVRFENAGFKFEPGFNDGHRLTAEVEPQCTAPTGTVTITSLKVNVIGFR